ncbi:MAG: hypothetical protein GY861_19575 [bacterium]|nr:hypothetical protein [bacterium]
MSIYLAFGPQIPLENTMYDSFIDPASPTHSIATQVLKEAKPVLGYDPVEKVRWATEQELQSTVNIQPNNFIVNEICRRAFMEKIPEGSISGVFGQSLGEYNGLLAAGVSDFQTMLDLVKARAKAMGKHFYDNEGKSDFCLGIISGMSEAGTNGLEWICQETGTYISNINRSFDDTEEQKNNVMTIAGTNQRVAWTIDLAKARGARRVKRLDDYNIAYHAPIVEMLRAADDFGKAVSKFSFGDPTIPVYRNVDGDIHIRSEMEKILVDHLINYVLLSCYETVRPYNFPDGTSSTIKNRGIIQSIVDLEDDVAQIFGLGRGTNSFTKYFKQEGTDIILANSPQTLQKISPE